MTASRLACMLTLVRGVPKRAPLLTLFRAPSCAIASSLVMVYPDRHLKSVGTSPPIQSEDYRPLFPLLLPSPPSQPDHVAFVPAAFRSSSRFQRRPSPPLWRNEKRRPRPWPKSCALRPNQMVARALGRFRSSILARSACERGKGFASTAVISTGLAVMRQQGSADIIQHSENSSPSAYSDEAMVMVGGC